MRELCSAYLHYWPSMHLNELKLWQHYMPGSATSPETHEHCQIAIDLAFQGAFFVWI